MSCIMYNRYMLKISVFNLEYYYVLSVNMIGDSALGLFLEAGSICTLHSVP